MVATYQLDAQDPHDPDSVAKIKLPGDLIERFFRQSNTKVENLPLVAATLRQPDAVFEGIRERSTGGWCYTKTRPSDEWTIQDNISSTFPAHLLFAVYLNPRMHVYEWRAERAVRPGSAYPEDWEARFLRCIWQRNP